MPISQEVLINMQSDLVIFIVSDMLRTLSLIINLDIQAYWIPIQTCSAILWDISNPK